MNEREAIEALGRRTNYEATGSLVAPSLDRIRALLDLLDNPQRIVPALHVTGTNGKTTCARAAAEVLHATGLSVGTYTSPHLVSVRERIACDGEPIRAKDFADTYAYLEPYLEEIDARGDRVTWFEAVTALGFVWFADKSVDAQVIEVGMGGTWDATNVVDAPVAVITEVSLDHPELGSTPAEIAREKAGIVAEGAVVLTAERDPAVLAVIEERCRARGAELRRAGQAFAISSRAPAFRGQSLDIRIGAARFEGIHLPLFGERMAMDALLGAAAVSAFLGDRDVDGEIIAQAFSRLRSPGRVEPVRHKPLVVLDGAHNPAAAEALAAAMRESFTWRRLVLVVGMLGDKDVRGVIATLAPLADEILVAPVASLRAAPAERLETEVRFAGRECTRASSVGGALALALERATEEDCVCVTGSLYTVGEAKVALAAEEMR